MAKKETRITVRLTERSAQKLDEAKKKGYSTSGLVNDLISKSVVNDINLKRNIMVHICKIQSELEFEQDPEIKKNVREELNLICQCLESSQGPTTVQTSSDT